MRGFIVIFLMFVFSQTVFSQVSEEYIVSTVDINDSSNNSGVSFFKQNYIIHTAPKKDINIHDTDFYVSLTDESGKVLEGELLGGNINSYINEIDFVFTSDKKRVYFTRSYKDDNDEKEHFDIYVANVTEDNKFINIKTLPINYKKYSTSHPCLSLDDKTLYFSSNRLESLGGFDIFKVSILENGKRYGKVINLGSNINSRGDEVTPFLLNNMLYFSSNGRGGMGKFDVFSVDLNLKKEAENLGETLNSKSNDFGFIRKKYRNYGFFISDREGGKGANDIYFFKVIEITPPPVKEVVENNKVTENEVVVKGKEVVDDKEEIVTDKEEIVTDKEIETNDLAKSGTTDIIIKEVENLDNSNIKKSNDIVKSNDVAQNEIVDIGNKGKIIDNKDAQITKVSQADIAKIKQGYEEKKPQDTQITEIVEVNITDQNQEYEEKIIYKDKKELAENVYDFQRREVYNTNREEVGRIRKLKKKLTKIEVKCIDRIEKLNDIYFDLNKFNIRPDAQIQVNKAIRIMEKCPNLKFIASSFTDSRGSSEYNRRLSQRRAMSVVNYILSNSGLSVDRILGIGYGESGLKNKCYNGVRCTEKEHQVNRRTEIEVSIK